MTSSQPYAAAIRPFITRASRFILVAEPTILGIASARLTQIGIERFGVPRENQVLVINNRVSRREVQRADIEENLGLKAMADLPEARAARRRHGNADRDVVAGGLNG